MGSYTQPAAHRQGVLDNGAIQGLVVLDKPGTLVTAMVYNNSGAKRYVHIYNLTSAPQASDVPHLPPLVVAADSNLALDVYSGVYFDTGITIISSTTADTFTAGGVSDLFIWATTR